MPHARPIARLRTAATAFAVLGLGLAVWAELSSRAWHADFNQWLIDEPMHVAVDLSKVGATTTRFCQTCSVSHGENIELAVVPVDGPTSTVDLTGLFMHISIADRNGANVSRITIHGEDVSLTESPVVLTQFVPFSEGDYTATIVVDSPAPALAGVEQILSAHYALCGLEMMPAQVAHVAAIFVGLLSGIGGVCVLPGLIRHGIWRAS